MSYVLRYGDLTEDSARVVARFDGGFQKLWIGRGDALAVADDWLLLPGDVVSRKHATITAGGPGHLLRDTSANGSFVNGERVKETVLADGDLIEVGHCLLSYRRIPKISAMSGLLDPDSRPPRLGPTRTLCPALVLLAHELEKLERRKRKAPADSVLLLGETGTGKDVIARHIHDLGAREADRSPPYVALNCAATPKDLFESLLFGHVRGAFTGATSDRPGVMREAHGGTLFLDEIGELPGSLQAKLLRVLEDRQVMPLGSNKVYTVAARFIAGTNADVFDPSSGFREDLRARLAGYVARLPPLRSRRDDLGILAAHALADQNLLRVEIEPHAARRFFHGPLQGNIRAFIQAIRTAALLASPDRIEERHLARVTPPLESESEPAGSPPPWSPSPARVRSGTARPSRNGLVQLFERWGTVRGVSDALGVSERTIGRWMLDLGVPAPRSRKPK
ncbi:MAG: sigma 54-interacting transcriptional regulator [Polyangiaceae bacterium]